MTEDADLEFEDWSMESAERALLALSRYVDHAQVSGMIIAALASHVSEEKLKTLVESEYWQNYQRSRHSLASSRKDVERLSRLIDRMREQAKADGGE